MEARVAAAVLGSVHLGTARSPAERWIVHNTPLGWCCIRGGIKVGQTEHIVNFNSGRSQSSPTCKYKLNKEFQTLVVPTCLCLVLTVRAAPVLGAGTFVLVNTFHTGTSILAGITFTLTYICGCREKYHCGQLAASSEPHVSIFSSC